MPPRSLYSINEIFDVLKNIEIFDEEGELKKKDKNNVDSVWYTALKNLKGINIHNLYMKVFNNIENLEINLKKPFWY